MRRLQDHADEIYTALTSTETIDDVDCAAALQAAEEQLFAMARVTGSFDAAAPKDLFLLRLMALHRHSTKQQLDHISEAKEQTISSIYIAWTAQALNSFDSQTNKMLNFMGRQLPILSSQAAKAANEAQVGEFQQLAQSAREFLQETIQRLRQRAVLSCRAFHESEVARYTTGSMCLVLL